MPLKFLLNIRSGGTDLALLPSSSVEHYTRFSSWHCFSVSKLYPNSLVYRFRNCCATATITMSVGMRVLLEHDEAGARETREGDIRSRSSTGLISLMGVFIFRLYNSYMTYYYDRVDGWKKRTHGKHILLF